MNNQEIRKCRADAEIYGAELKKIHDDENHVFEAALHGKPFPDDLTFRGRLAEAWWDGIEQRKL